MKYGVLVNPKHNPHEVQRELEPLLAMTDFS